MNKKISIIIPAYNEEKRIKKTIQTYSRELKKENIEYEIIVVFNGCIDNSIEVGKKLEKKHKRIKIIIEKSRIGKGGAIIKGFKHAKGNIIGFVDADQSTHSKSVIKLIKVAEVFDGAIASRYCDGAYLYKKQPLIRRIASRCFNIWIKLLFGLKYKDTQCGAKFFQKKAIKKILPELGLTGWAFDIELLYRLNQESFVICEVPVNWKNDINTKLNMKKVIPKMLLSTLVFRIRSSKKLRPLTYNKISDAIYMYVKKIT
ncbi:glycosyltransferase [Candidatus Micrarchaeota archaeon]|nr:glycosyltransferase [Candidatus Micrarchaeota archaeon]